VLEFFRMLFDSHCHLPSLKQKEKTEDLIKEAKAEGVVRLINAGTSLKDSAEAAEVAGFFDDVYSTAGVYPHEEMGKDINVLQDGLQKLIDSHNKIVAVGECGIDISERPGRNIFEQRELFAMQIRLALENDLPIVIHNRNADGEIINILKKFQSSKLRGVSHCFSSSWETAREFIILNFYISFSGLITYRSGEGLLETVKKVPADKFLLETDAPYLPPEGKRGGINKPKYVKIIARKVAQTRKEPFERICEHSFNNTCALFL
jgi:TatD DNase family protein